MSSCAKSLALLCLIAILCLSIVSAEDPYWKCLVPIGGEPTKIDCAEAYSDLCPDAEILESAVCSGDGGCDEVSKPALCQWLCEEGAPATPIPCEDLYATTCPVAAVVDAAICNHTNSQACARANLPKPTPCQWLCTSTEGVETPCDELYATTCPDVDVLGAATCSKTGEPIPCNEIGLTKPTLCTYDWKCAKDQTVDSAQAVTCTDSDFAQWTLTVAEAVTTLTRDVRCVTTRDDEIVVDGTVDKCVVGEKPLDTFTADVSKANLCLEYGGTSSTYSDCPVIDKVEAPFTDALQLKYCTGHSESIQQNCVFTYTQQSEEEGVTPIVLTNTVACDGADIIPFNCPVYIPKCLDKYGVKNEEDSETDPEDGETGPEDGETGPTQFKVLHHHDREDEEIGAAICAVKIPTCPTCSKANIPLLSTDDWTTPKAQFLVRCYIKVAELPEDPSTGEAEGHDETDTQFNLQHDEQDAVYELISDLSDAQYQICLRGGNLVVDPQTKPLEAPCPEIGTCPYHLCKDTLSAQFGFDACYDKENFTCTKTEDFPICLGTATVNNKCYLNGLEQTEDQTACATITMYEAPVLTTLCEPLTCPAFSWATDAVETDELDSDFGEEETTSGSFIVIDGTKITATLSNLTIDADNKWSLEVYRRVAELNEKQAVVVKYEKVNSLTQTDIVTPTATVEVSPTHLPLGTYFVLRAKYDKYTLITEEESGDCEVLGLEGLYPADPVCGEIEEESEEPEKDGETVPIKTTADSTDGETEDGEGESEEEPVDLTKQSPGREKLGLVVTGCHLQFGNDCTNGSTCESTTEGIAIVYQCSTCPQLFSGTTCGTCDLTSVCLNGSTPFVSTSTNPQTPAGSFGAMQAPTNGTEGSDAGNEEESTIDQSSNGECRCACLKTHSGLRCDCTAVYFRLDFKTKLLLNQDQTEQQWTKELLSQIATASQIDATVFEKYGATLYNPTGNHFLGVIAACALPQQSSSSSSSSSSSFLSLQAQPGSYSATDVQDRWTAFRSTDQSNTLTAASQVGGISAVSSAYDASCTANCSADVTDPAYVPEDHPSPPQPVDDKGSSNAWWIILIILLIVVAAALVIIAVRHFMVQNRQKNFGGARDDHLDMAEIS